MVSEKGHELMFSVSTICTGAQGPPGVKHVCCPCHPPSLNFRGHVPVAVAGRARL